MRTPIIAVLLLAPGLALAEDASFGGFAHAISHGDYVEAGELTDPAPPIIIDGMPVTPAETTMVDVARRLGGTIHDEGEAGEHVVWSCYIVSDAVLWFYSDGEMGDGKVDLVALERTKPESAWSCARIEDLTMIDFGLPRLGDPLSEIESRFGPASPDDDGRFGYRYDAGNLVQFVVFRITEGVVTGVSVEQPAR